MMEQELGVKLFHRHSKKVELSSAGAYLQTEFEALLNEIDIIVGNARKLDARYTGTVTVGVTDLEELPGLAKAMQVFRKEYPDAFVKIKVAPFSQLVQDIQDGELDIVCCMRSPAASIAGFHRTFLRKGHFFCLVPTSSPLASKKELTPQDIEGNTWIFLGFKKQHAHCGQAAKRAAGHVSGQHDFIQRLAGSVGSACQGWFWHIHCSGIFGHAQR